MRRPVTTLLPRSAVGASNAHNARLRRFHCVRLTGVVREHSLLAAEFCTHTGEPEGANKFHTSVNHAFQYRAALAHALALARRRATRQPARLGNA